jgi:uncharacterized SAM-binding protein YcdF (DUF218 family)
VTRQRWLRSLGWFAAGAGTMLLLWSAGLVWFVHSSLTITADTSETDAIVVLTGGRSRLEEGFDLLGAGRAPTLFISGVNPHVDRSELMRAAGHAADNDANRIFICHEAYNTLGNARETAGWMQQRGYRSLRLVTSWYHMQRSLLEFGRAMPDTRIIAEPVFASHEGDARSGWADTALLTVSEYNKYLATLLLPEIAMIWPRFGETRMTDSDDSSAVTPGQHRP